METRTETTFDTIQNENHKIIGDYIEARKTETGVNISANFQSLAMRTLNYLSRHTRKNFKDVTREDIVSFLNSLRKSETEDPTHRWIGTYISDRRVSIDSAIITFRCWSDAVVTAVHVRDGRQEAPIAVYDGLYLNGDHPSERFSVPNRPQVFSAIDIGVHVNFHVDTPLWIDFVAAGANFVI